MARTLADEYLGVDALVQDFNQPIRSGWLGAKRRHPYSERRGADRVGLVATDVAMWLDAEQVGVIDLSVSGIQLRCNRPLARGTTLLLHVQWRGDYHTSVALGRVVWACAEGGHTRQGAFHRVGAVFEQFDIKTFKQIAQRYGVGVSRTVLEVVDHRW